MNPDAGPAPEEPLSGEPSATTPGLLVLSLRSGEGPGMASLAEAAAAEAAPASAKGDSILDLDAEAAEEALTLRGHLKEMGLEETDALDATGTLRPAPYLGEGFAAPESTAQDLPRISVDLPLTLPAPEPDRRAPRSSRPDLEVQRALGEGGMGKVFLARQRSLDREVAIKTLRDGASPRHREALIAEGAVTGHLEHPGIIPVHALGVHEDGRPVLVMKRVNGVAWQELLRNPAHPAWEGWGGGPQDRLEGHLGILMQVCNAAHFAHSRGVVHRDIKPQNVLIGRFGDVYLADWGIALRLGRPGRDQFCGTPGYMAPEMARGGAVDERTDIYLLGAVLHEILTGRIRHEGPNVGAVLKGAAQSRPYDYPDTVPADLAALANQATARNPRERPASAAAFRQALADHLQHKSSVALGATAAARLAQLRALLESGGGEAEAVQREADQLIIETRFALRQALEAWDGNPAAQRDLEALDAMLEARRARAAELERMARDLDPSVSGRYRTLALAGVAAAALVLALPALLRGPRYLPSGKELLLTSFAPLALVLLLVLLLRRHLGKSAVNRRTALGLLIIVAAVSCNRALALRAGLPPSAMLMYDCFIGAVVSGFAGATMLRGLHGIAALVLLAAALIALLPQYAFFIFSLSSSIALLLGCALLSHWVLRKAGRN